MNTPYEDQEKIEIIHIEPVYDFAQVSGGHFLIKLNNDTAFKLNFLIFIRHLTERDEKLFDYIQKTANSDKTASHIIFDLYDLGVDIDRKVETYMKNLGSTVDLKMLSALMDFYTHMKYFGDTSGSLD